MRKIILNLAVSIDGRIIDENGSFDWIHGDNDSTNNTKKQFNFHEFTKSCDTLISGKKAFKDIPFGESSGYDHLKVYVLTHSTEKPSRDNVQYIHGDLAKFVSELKKQDGSNIWVFGGASVCNILINANLIDQYIIGFIPAIVGNGVRLFEDGNPLTRLHLKECTVTDGIVMAIYERESHNIH